MSQFFCGMQASQLKIQCHLMILGTLRLLGN
jgi:hypothetical protein